MLMSTSIILSLLIYIMTNILVLEAKFNNLIQFRVHEKSKKDELIYKAINAGINYYVNKSKEIINTEQESNLNKSFHFCGYKNLENNFYGIYNITFLLKKNALINPLYYSLLNIKVIRVDYNINLFDKVRCETFSNNFSIFSKTYLFNL